MFREEDPNLPLLAPRDQAHQALANQGQNQNAYVEWMREKIRNVDGPVICFVTGGAICCVGGLIFGVGVDILFKLGAHAIDKSRAFNGVVSTASGIGMFGCASPFCGRGLQHVSQNLNQNEPDDNQAIVPAPNLMGR